MKQEAADRTLPLRRDPWLWTGLACALGFLVLAVMAAGGAAFALDDPVTTAVQGLAIPAWFWEACSFVGGWEVRVPVAIALVLVALLTGRLRLGLILAFVFLAAPVFVEVSKTLIDRPRPPDPLVVTSGASFPSGHTLDSTVTYGVLALVAWWSPLPVALRAVLVVIGVAVPLLTGLSRIALGAHYPSDVLGGWLAGLAFVALAAVLIRATGAMTPDRPARAP